MGGVRGSKQTNHTSVSNTSGPVFNEILLGGFHFDLVFDDRACVNGCMCVCARACVVRCSLVFCSCMHLIQSRVL